MFISLLVYLLLAPIIQAQGTSETTSSIFNVSVYPNAVPSEVETVTIVDVDATATTFHYGCVESNSLRFVPPTDLWPTGSKPRPTPFDITASVFTCNWYTFTQGPSTWAMSFNDQNISFSGTCTMIDNLGVCTSNYAYSSTALGNGGGGVEWNKDQRTVLAEVEPTCKYTIGRATRLELVNAYHVCG